MLSRRFILRAACVAGFVAPLRAFAADEPPVAIVQSFYDALLQAMKGGKKLGFAGRRDLLTPAVHQAFDLPLMTRITVGAAWNTISGDDQKRLIDAFSAYSVASYANHFDDYSGEKFVVDPKTVASGGDVIVQSKLVPTDDKPVDLNYLMRRGGDTWRIIDVFLSGTISELASRRSEFSATLRSGGAPALIKSLQQKTAELAN